VIIERGKGEGRKGEKVKREKGKGGESLFKSGSSPEGGPWPPTPAAGPSTCRVKMMFISLIKS